MPGRNRDEAWRSFTEPLARTVGAVDMAMRLTAKHHTDDVSSVTTSAPGICLTRTSGSEMQLYAAMTLRCIEDPENGPYRMTTLRYDYELSERGSVVFGWHWHPVSKRSQVKWPHLHPPVDTPYCKKHIPTARIALEDILLFAIHDLDVRPAYDGAVEVLEEISRTHKNTRSWA